MWFYFIYRYTTYSIKIYIHYLINQRLKNNKEDSKRYKERFGINQRYSNYLTPIIWIHGVSVGEIRAALSLALALQENNYQGTILLTYTTKTASEIVKNQTLIHSSNIIDQFIPFDIVPYVKKFLDKWPINLAIFIENELWPNMLYELNQRHIPTLLISARFGKQTKKHFSYLPKIFIKKLLFQWLDAIYPADKKLKQWLERWGKVQSLIQLKYATPSLIYDNKSVNNLQKKLEYRLVWIASCTHPSDENIILETHYRLKKIFPTLLTIWAPRHLDRIPPISSKLSSKTQVAFLSKDNIEDNTDIYFIDQFNKLGMVYALHSIVYLGGGYGKHGGHNPIEPAQLGNAIIVGPDTSNNDDIVSNFLNHHAIIQLPSNNTLQMDAEILDFHVNNLYNSVLMLFNHPKQKHTMMQNGKNITQYSKAYRKDIAHIVCSYLKQQPNRV